MKLTAPLNSRIALPSNLQLRMMLFLVAIIAVVLGAVDAALMPATEARLRDDVRTLGTDYAEILSLSGGVYVEVRDTDGLQKIADSATDADRIEFVSFSAADGEQLVTSASADAPDSARAPFDAGFIGSSSGGTVSRWTGEFLEVARPIAYRGRQVGVLALRIDRELLNDELRQSTERALLTAGALVVLLSAAAGYMLRRVLLDPLFRLSRAAERIGRGEWVSPEGVGRRDEFGTLARSFDQMLGSLRSREAQLREQVDAVSTLNAELDARVAERTRELGELVEGQRALLAQIRDMSTPVVPLADGVIVMPVVGTLDGQRAAQLIERMLAGIQSHRARLAILDITGVPVVDSQVAQVIVRAAASARLVGARAALVGIRPEVAQTLVQLGLLLDGVSTFATLQDALGAALRR